MLNRSNLQLILFLTTLFLNTETNAQSTQAMYYLNYPRSVYSLGMGEQSVALRTSDDALTYNPANLVFVERPMVSFFHQPFQMASSYFDLHIPLNSYSAKFKLKDVGAFGIEYINWDWGESVIRTFEHPEGEGKLVHSYERSFSIGYAREFCENFSAGIQMKYAKSSLGPGSAEKYFFSAGLNYSPQLLDYKLNLGFSLTNFGTTVIYVDEAQADPPPSKLNLGIGFLPIDNNFYSLQTQFAISKQFDAHPVESSFKGLFNDWKDFPNDATLHTGIAFNWKSLDLGNGFAFFQEFYLGNLSVGNKSGLYNFYTHGGKIGIEFDGLQFSAGYAGRWHNVHPHNYAQWTFPWETVQFSLGMSEDLIFGKEREKSRYAKPQNIILSFGVGKSFRVGNFRKAFFYPYYNLHEEFKDDIVISLEGAFYLDEQSAVVANLSYSPADYFINYEMQHVRLTKVEIFSISSSYRYHPLELFLPLFIQGGLSIVRLNPTSKYFYPKYDYKTALLFSIGANVNVYQEIVLTPFVNYSLMLSKDGNTAPRLGGFNQFDLGVKAGYKF